ncbi:MAG: hypothetical protein BGO76_04500 [Caedibacter sp. 38-128]|nr:type IV secretion system DNA-binding domain-containing protein [Holosporales bacterium]OJX08925.1 MAG: hypothetical protein BGO76_04500 [Caedibacter sp. 38-128]
MGIYLYHGWHYTRRYGVSLNQQTHTKPIILPTGIQNLKDLEAYIKLPGNYSITKLKMPYQQVPQGSTKVFDIKVMEKPLPSEIQDTINLA